MERWDAYKNAEDGAISKIQAGLKLSRVTSSLPASFTREKSHRPALEQLHKEFVESVGEKIRSAVDEVAVSVDLKTFLDNLDSVVASNSSQERAWRPSRKAADNQAAHDATVLSEAQDKLERKILAKLESEVAELNRKVSELSDDIATKSTSIRKMMDDIECLGQGPDKENEPMVE